MSKKLDLNDLLSNIKSEENIGMNKDRQKILDKFDSYKKIKHQSYKKVSSKIQKKLDREETYKVVNKDISKWQPIVKKHREAAQIDFRTDKDDITMNFNNKISLNNKDQREKTKILKKQKLLTQEQLDQRLNEKIKDSENKEKIHRELMKQKHLLLYKELKAKKLKKIKSKLYRRIRKRNKEKKDEANLHSRLQSDRPFALEELEKMERKRAEERASLRHRNKTKYTQMLKKYADDKAVQVVYSTLNQKRRIIIEKLKDITQVVDEDNSSYDENYQDQAVEEIENEFLEEEIVREEPKNILEKILARNDHKLRKEAEILKGKIENREYDDIEFSEEDEFDEEGRVVKRDKVFSLNKGGKKVYDNDEMKIEEEDEEIKKKKRIDFVNIEELLDEKLEDSEEDKEKMINIEKNLELTKKDEDEILLEGIDINKMKKRYREAPIKLNKEDMKIFENENDQDEYNNIETNGLDKNEFEENFRKEKIKEFEDELPAEDPYENMDGWGNWTGFGVVHKNKEEKLRKKKIEKIKKIKEIMRKRKDHKYDRVIINEKRNKNLKKYFVEKVPHGYDNVNQFNFEMSRPIGTEWNSEMVFKNKIKNNIETNTGEIIKPLNQKHLPKVKYI